MNNIVFTLFFLVISNMAMSQEKSSNIDLRGRSEVFEINEVKGKSKTLYKLETSVSGEFRLSKSENSKKRIQKLDSQKAVKFDELFSDYFISMKYMMSTKKIKDCQFIYMLSMRGEKYKICNSDGDRKKIVSEFLVSLQAEFK